MTQTDAQKTRIVVGCDLSETGDHAIRQAVQLAKQIAGSELHVTHVIPTGRDVHDARKLEQLSRELTTKLDQLRAHVATVCAPAAPEPAFRVECVFHVRLGDPAPELHQVAVDVDANLIVVGTHGRSRASELILGSVAQALMRSARVSVLVAHPNQLSELPKSSRVEPAHGGEYAHPHGVSNRVHLEFLPRTPHISGLL